MTETTGGSVATMFNENCAAHVGGPCANVKIKLRDIPEAGYLSTNIPPRGEICFYGGSIMKGYFNNAEKTKESFTDDGWLMSGDVGVIMDNGQIKIIDRAKNIFKLSQGEYISPEKVETILVQSPYLQMCFVTGDALQDYCVMVGVVEPAALKKWANAEPTEEMCRHPDFIQEVFNDLNDLGTKRKLNSLEKPKGLYLTLNPFTIENDLLTSTAKLKRNIAKEYFKEQVKQMYQQGPIMPQKPATDKKKD